jgi:hypothetical protein
LSIEDELVALNFPQFPIPLRIPAVSGLYAHAQEIINLPIPTPAPNFPPIPDPGPINPRTLQPWTDQAREPHRHGRQRIGGTQLPHPSWLWG